MSGERIFYGASAEYSFGKREFCHFFDLFGEYEKEEQAPRYDEMTLRGLCIRFDRSTRIGNKLDSLSINKRPIRIVLEKDRRETFRCSKSFVHFSPSSSSLANLVETSSRILISFSHCLAL